MWAFEINAQKMKAVFKQAEPGFGGREHKLQRFEDMLDISLGSLKLIFAFGENDDVIIVSEIKNTCAFFKDSIQFSEIKCCKKA